MADDLVTAAVFGDQTQAVAARMHLEEAGVPAFLADELMSQGLFVVGGATGGIRLQVPASRLDDAIRLINDRLPGHAAPVDWSQVDVGWPEGEDEAGGDGTAATPPAVRPETAAPAPVDEAEPTDLTVREQRADRIVRGALIGLFAWPVLLFAIWRLIQIASSDERLRPAYQRKANQGAVIVLVALLAVMSWACCLWPPVLGY